MSGDAVAASTRVADDPVARAELQRRVLKVLWLGQVVGGAAMAASVTIGAFVIQDLLGHETPWAGLASATMTIGTAFMSQLLSRRMNRRGRRPGLQLGYALAAVGGVVAAIGVETSSLPIFLIGLFVFGNGQASNLLARYAATDLAAPEERSRAMSRIVFASTFGAVFGPTTIGPAEYASEHWFGLHRYGGPWLLSAALYLLAMLNTAVRLRPDPLVAAGAIGGERTPHTRVSDGLRVIGASQGARLALLAMVISQVTMTSVMAMTPVHMKLHGHENISQYVVSLHIAGMYALSPLVGRYADRRGRIPAIMIGGAVLTASTMLAAVSGDAELLLFPALWGLGLGWNFGLIGGSSLLVDSVPIEHRVGVQGTADLMMSFCGGMAGFASGFVRRAIGYHLLATAAAIAAGVLLVAAYTALRRPASDDAVPVPGIP